MTLEYTIEQLTDYEKVTSDKDLIYFFYHAGATLGIVWQNKFNWENFQLEQHITNNRFMLCRKNGKPVGFHLSRIGASALDPTKRIAYQDILYTLPNTRAAKLLMDDFIDFGKREADHIITMISHGTNIKPKSLIKLGFSPLEMLYRLEC